MSDGDLLFTDDLGRQIRLPKKPKRIISLCPSITYSLIALGCKEQLVGKTRYCIHPQNETQLVPNIGGVHQVDIPLIQELSPDLIIADKQENRKKEVMQLAEKFPVYVCDVYHFQQNSLHLEQLGALCGIEKHRVQAITSEFTEIKTQEIKPKVLYLIWKDPWMSVSVSTYTGSMLEYFGFENVIRNETAYPQVHPKDFLNAELILLSSEPYAFTEKHQQMLAHQYPEKKIILVDGEMFSWYGAWFQKSINYKMQLLTSTHITL